MTPFYALTRTMPMPPSPDTPREIASDDAENSGPVLGSGDFLTDSGYPDPEEARIKMLFANGIALAIKDARLTQAKAAAMSGLGQPDVSRIVNGQVKGFSLFRLMQTLAALGKDVRIGWSDADGDRGRVLAGPREVPGRHPRAVRVPGRPSMATP